MEKKNKIKLKNFISTNLFVYSFLLIPLLNLAVFYFYVNINSFFMSFRAPEGIADPFYYYEMMFKRFTDPNFYLAEAFVNTLRFFCLSTFILLPLGFIFAFFLFKKIRGYKFFRIMLFFPGLISSTIFVSLFKQIVGSNGILFSLISAITKKDIHIDLIGNPDYAIWTILGYCFWTGFGGNFLLAEGAMARIPDDVLEYAKLDGVSPIREFVSIIIPMIFPTVSTLLVMSFVSIFGASGPILLFFQNSRQGIYTIDYLIYDLTAGSQSGSSGLAAAIGLFFTAIEIPIVFLVGYITKKIDRGVQY